MNTRMGMPKHEMAESPMMEKDEEMAVKKMKAKSSKKKPGKKRCK